VYHRTIVEELSAKVAELVAAYAKKFPLRLGIPKEEVRRKVKFKGGANEWNAITQSLAEHASWVVVGDRIGLTDQGPALTAVMARAVEAAARELQACGLEWPGLDNWAEDSPVFKSAVSDPALEEFKLSEVVRHLVDHGHAVAINNEYLVAADAWGDLQVELRDHFASETELTFAIFRELSGLTRKLGIPMLEYLDQSGVTVRKGDIRVAGPALEEK
jgi:selenocysteine-specific elongation factor